MTRSVSNGRVAADRDAAHEGGRAEHADHHAAPLALEVRVGGHQEQRGELHAHERVGRHELEREQQREVDRGHRRVKRELRLATREHEHRGRPQREHAEHEGGAAVVGEAEDRDRREGDDRHHQPRDREHRDRRRRVDRAPGASRRATSRASATAGAP